MTRSTPWTVLLTPLLLTAATGCPGGGKSFECDRAAGSPVRRGYLGEPGADGCGDSMTCASEPGDDGGTCVEEATAQCVLDGLTEGEGVSKDCAEDEVCVVEAGGWYGLCEPYTTTVDGISGTADCGAPVSEALTVGPGEVITFESTFSAPANGNGANVSWTLSDANGTLTYSGNPLGPFGYAQGSDVDLDLTYSFQKGANLSWQLSVTECESVDVVARYTRETGPVLNTDLDAGAPLAKGEPASALIGCYDAGGDGASQHLTHLYALEAAAGDVLNLSLSVEGFGAASAAITSLTLESDAGEVLESGNPVSLDTSLDANPSRDFTVTEGGLYYLRVDTETTDCDVTRYTVAY